MIIAAAVFESCYLFVQYVMSLCAFILAYVNKETVTGSHPFGIQSFVFSNIERC